MTKSILSFYCFIVSGSTYLEVTTLQHIPKERRWTRVLLFFYIDLITLTWFHQDFISSRLVTVSISLLHWGTKRKSCWLVFFSNRNSNLTILWLRNVINNWIFKSSPTVWDDLDDGRKTSGVRSTDGMNESTNFLYVFTTYSTNRDTFKSDISSSGLTKKIYKCNISFY